MFLTNTVLCCAYYTGESCFEVKSEAASSDHTERPHNDNTKPRLSTMKNSLNVHQKQHAEEKCYSCTECDKRYSNRYAFISHMNIHRGKHKCTECGRCCPSKTYLEEHRKRHLGHKTFECTVCGKRFIRSWELTVHSITHSREKPYKCYICEQMFSRYDHLKVHVRIHIGEKPYKCLLCNKSFSGSSSLQQHKRREHSSATDEPKEDENVKFECVGGDSSVDGKDENLAIAKLESDDVSCLWCSFPFVLSQQKNCLDH